MRSECDTARFRGYPQNSHCLAEIVIKIELLFRSWQQITATRPVTAPRPTGRGFPLLKPQPSV